MNESPYCTGSGGACKKGNAPASVVHHIGRNTKERVRRIATSRSARGEDRVATAHDRVGMAEVLDNHRRDFVGLLRHEIEATSRTQENARAAHKELRDRREREVRRVGEN